jgi:carbonic anhydrase
MIREVISHKDFLRIGKENEFYIWHFLQKNQDKNLLSFSSVLEEKKEYNELKVLLEHVDIPYFESYTEDSIDFLNNLGFSYKSLWKPYTPGQRSYFK